MATAKKTSAPRAPRKSAAPADPTAPGYTDPRDDEIAQLRAQLADAQSAGADVTQPPSDPRDTEIEQLRKQVAEFAEKLTEATTSAKQKARNAAVTSTATVTPAEADDSYVPKVRDLVDFTTEDPLDGSTISGVGLVLDVTDKHAIVAPLQPLHLPVVEFTPRHKG